MQPAASAAPAAAPQFGVLAIAATLLVLLAWASAAHGARMVALAGLGFAIGLTLYQAAFGFTAAYRSLLERRGTRAVRAQLLMLGAATLLFAPALAGGTLFGTEVVGAVAPAGVAVAAGAFLFGIGMQLAGGCGSGSLYTAGGGSARMLLVLAAFCAGGFWASLHMDLWQQLPAPDAFALGEAFGWPTAVLLQLALLGGLWTLLRLPKWADGDARSPPAGLAYFVQGPWPLAAGALLLAAANFATLAVAGYPWSITWAFTLWGAKAARILGWQPGSSPFWNAEFQRQALEASVFADVTSVMDFGIVLGAAAAAALAGRFKPAVSLSAGAAATALAGGLAMGYGARIAFGCNIGAFFSGVASTSLHGWLWIAAALPGCWIGLRMHRLLRTR
ncbi:MAG: YeeE/YedE family protein [Woeseiaceae bacterium]